MKKTSVSPSPKETPYSAAIAQHQEAQLNVAFTRRLLSCNGWLGIALTGAIVINGYLAWKVANPPLAVVASDNGRIIPLPAMNKATYSDADIIDYGARATRANFTLDFVHYREQINARQDSFSDEGFVSYYNALVSSGILEKVKEKRMNLSVLTSSGIIQSKGVLDNGHYAWRVQYPITLRLNGQSTSLPPQNFILTMMIETADPRLKKDGLNITQVITQEPRS